VGTRIEMAKSRMLVRMDDCDRVEIATEEKIL
jgi:hypothetical protein